MPSEVHADSSAPLRLHPVSLLFIFSGLIRRFLFPAVVILAASLLGSERRDSKYELWASAFFVPAAVGAIVRYLSFRYRFLEDELVIQSGIFHRTERHIPFERIQNIDTTQNPFHRFLGVAEASVETASGGEPEARLRVLSITAIEAMRARAGATRTKRVDTSADATTQAELRESPDERAPADPVEPLAPPAPTPRVLVRVPTRDLLFLGVFSLRGLAVVGMGFGLLWQFGGSEESRLLEMFSWFNHLDLGHGTAMTLRVIAGVFAFLLAVVTLSMILSVTSLHGFTLSRDGNELRIRFGFFTQRTLTLPRHRVQALMVEEPWWLRLRGHVAVRVRTAGGGEGPTGRAWLAPTLPRDRLEEILGEIHSSMGPRVSDWHPLHASTFLRLFRIETFNSLLVSAGLAVWLGAWAWLAFVPLVASSYLACRLRARCTGYCLTDDVIHYRTGVLRRVQTSIPFTKIQSVGQSESPFDRRWGMTTLQVDTAGSEATSGALTIKYLPRDVGDAMRRHLGHAAARNEFRW